MFNQINFPEIFEGTYHILAIYLGILIGSVILFLFVRRFDTLIGKLNQIRITKDKQMFKWNYAFLTGIFLVILVSILLIGPIEFRMNPTGFQIFAFFAFIAMPIAMGFSAVYIYILKGGEYRIGDGILLLLSLTMFAMCGVHIHDVIWCGVATQGYTIEQIGGYDLAQFFTLFQITDPAQWDYRTFGLYMSIRALIELTVATLAYNKFIKVNLKRNMTISRKQKVFPYVLFLIAAILFGIFEYVFDSPWNFTDIQYQLNLYVGIPIVAIIFIVGGLNLPSQIPSPRENSGVL
jgi:hypothetical protein